MTMKDHLFSLNADSLKTIARTLGCLEKGATAKADVIDALERAIKSHPQEFLAALTDPERKFFAEALYDEIPSEWMFHAKYGCRAPKTSGYWGHGEKPGVLVAVIHHDRLLPSALVPGLKEIYQPLVEAPDPPTATTTETLPEEYEGRVVRIFSGEAAMPAELTRVLRLIQSGKVLLAKSSKRPTEASVRALAEVLIQPDFDLEYPKEERRQWEPAKAGPVRAHAWGVLAQQCGWAKPRAGRLLLTDAGKAIMGQFTPERFEEGISEFVWDDDFDELQRVNHIRGQTGKAKRWITPPSERRDAFASGVKNCPVGKWMTFSEIARLIAASGGDHTVTKEGLYIGDAHYGGIYDSSGLSMQYFRALIMESFATLGLFDIAYCHPHDLWPEFGDAYGSTSHSFLGRYDGLLYVRLNPLGAWGLGEADSYAAPQVETAPILRVLPNHEIVATAAPDPASAAFLELFADRKSDAVWSLDGEKTLLFIESGGRMEDLRAFLDSHSSGEIPENVGVWFDSLEQKSGSCRKAEKAILFEWKDSAQAALLASSSGTSRLCHHAGENRIVVPTSKLAAFTRTARRMGFILPKS